MSAFNTQSLVNWNYPLADYNGFFLEKSSNSGSTWTSSLSCSSDTTSFIDNDVTWGDYRWYRVAALNPFGSSSKSNLAEVFINSPGIDTPRLTGSQQANDTMSVLTWNYTGSSQGAADYFVLERSMDSGSTWPAAFLISPTGSSYIDDGVAYGLTYWYRVHAHCDFGLYGPYSNTASVYVDSGVVPGPPPMTPILLMVTSGSAILNWSGSTDAVYYDIYKAINDESGSYNYWSSSTVTHSVDHDVTASNTYYYKVAGVNGNGSSSFSNIAALALIQCSGSDFPTTIHTGLLGYSSGSTYRNTYGVLIPFNTATTQSISLWGRSQDFDVYLTLVDATGSVLIENDWDGWVPSGDVNFGNAAIAYNLKSGSYNIEVSSANNAIGRYQLYVSPGPRLETTWSNGYETATIDFIPTSNTVVVGEQGSNIVFYNLDTQTQTLHNYSGGTYGACYSPAQDSVFAKVYFQVASKWTASIVQYDNAGNYVGQTDYPRPVSMPSGNSRLTQNGDNTVYLTDDTGTISDLTVFPSGSRIFVYDPFAFTPSYNLTITSVTSARTASVVEVQTYTDFEFQITPPAPFGTIDFGGYLCYDEKNDRILFTEYNGGVTYQDAVVWDCATKTSIQQMNIKPYNAASANAWQCCYSWVDNAYYIALTGYHPMVKIDASTFAISNTATSATILASYISSSNLMMIRGSGSPGHVQFYDPLTDAVIYTRSDLPSTGLFEGGGVGDDCTNVYVAAIDSQNGPNVSGLALLDRNTFLPQNYLTINNENTPFDQGWYQYAITFAKPTSRIYSAQVDYDNYEGRIYSTRLSRGYDAGPLEPFTASSADTASCMWYSGSFKITESLPGDWMGRAYPGYITTTNDRGLGTMVVSDNEYFLDTFTQHNRHNWFFNLDGTIRYNDYTESFVHTWPGKNAVFCDGKYFMLSDGLIPQSVFGEAITASSMLIFDRTGSLLNTIALTYGGMDWDTDGQSVWVYEHDGTNTYLEELTGSDGSIQNTQPIIGDLSANTMTISATASMTNNLSYGYYQGKMMSWKDSSGFRFSVVNNGTNLGVESGSGDLLRVVQDGYFAGYGYGISMADDGVSGYGAWAGSVTYCPLTNTIFIGAWGAAPDYAPIVIETNTSLVPQYTYDLSAYSASFYSADDIKWNRKNRTLELYNNYSTPPGQILVLDPIAHTVVCQLDPLAEQPVGASCGQSIAVEPISGDVYFPQRFDGDVSALTGSVKRYQTTPLVIPDPPVNTASLFMNGDYVGPYGQGYVIDDTAIGGAWGGTNYVFYISNVGLGGTTITSVITSSNDFSCSFSASSVLPYELTTSFAMQVMRDPSGGPKTSSITIVHTDVSSPFILNLYSA